MGLKKIGRWLLDAFFPVSCFSCAQPQNAAGNPDGFVCTQCRESIALHAWLFCPVCNKKLIGTRPCASHPGPMRFLGVAGSYQNDLLKHLIWRYKYEYCEPLAQPLGKILSDYFQATCKPYCGAHPGRWIVTSIPLSKRRMRWRGFNQAALLARELAHEHAFPYAETLIRTRYVAPQMELPTRQARLRNVEHAFAAAPSADVKQKRIILVDDIATSGATLTEAARMLKSAGAQEVIGLVLARNNSD